MLKYVSKFVLDVFPSVIATIIGAYIVNHYIVNKPAAEAPVATAVSTADPVADPKRTDAKAVKSDTAKSDIKGSETPSDVATAPEPAAVKKGMPDKASVTETASLPAETRRHQPSTHDKTPVKAVAAPAPAQTPAPAVAAVAPVEASPTQEERRDANELARAAIERLRSSGEASRSLETSRVQDSPRVVVAPVPPLPPAIMVSTPTGDAFNPNGASSLRPSYAPGARLDDPRRPTPPADIPASPPMDLHAEATASIPARATVADDVLSAARSVFHAVLPR
jgi:hypothetical protein